MGEFFLSGFNSYIYALLLSIFSKHTHLYGPSFFFSLFSFFERRGVNTTHTPPHSPSRIPAHHLPFLHTHTTPRIRKTCFQHSKMQRKKTPTFLFGCSCSSDVLSVQDFYCSSYILISLMDNTIRGQRSTSFPLEHVEKYASSPVSFLSCGIRG